MDIEQIMNLVKGRWKTKDGSYYLFSLTNDEWMPLEISKPNKLAETHHFKVLHERNEFVLQIMDSQGQVLAATLKDYSLHEFYLVTNKASLRFEKVR